MREVIAAILRQDRQVDIPRTREARRLLVRSAVEEGVVALVGRALDEQAGLGEGRDELAADIAVLARLDVAQAMFRDAEIARVLECLSAAGQSVLLLKGAALANWLYERPELRSCGDIDVLLEDRAAVEAALSSLRQAGYASDITVPPGDMVGYQLCCRREMGTTPGWEIDLHWKLSNSPLFASVFTWEELFASARPIPRLGTRAFGLSTVHAFFHACIHRAASLQFGEANKLRWIYDIHLLAGQLTSGQWQEVVTLCTQRGLAGTCLSSLIASRKYLRTPIPVETLEALSGQAKGESLQVEKLDSWTYSQWATFRSIPGARPRLRWLRQRMIPDLEFLRQSDPTGTGRLAPSLLLRLKLAIARISQGRRR